MSGWQDSCSLCTAKSHPEQAHPINLEATGTQVCSCSAAAACLLSTATKPKGRNPVNIWALWRLAEAAAPALHGKKLMIPHSVQMLLPWVLDNLAHPFALSVGELFLVVVVLLHKRESATGFGFLSCRLVCQTAAIYQELQNCYNCKLAMLAAQTCFKYATRQVGADFNFCTIRNAWFELNIGLDS